MLMFSAGAPAAPRPGGPDGSARAPRPGLAPGHLELCRRARGPGTVRAASDARARLPAPRGSAPRAGPGAERARRGGPRGRSQFNPV